MRHLRTRTKIALVVLAAAVVFSGLFLAYRYFTSNTFSSRQIGVGVAVSGNNLPGNLQATLSRSQAPYNPKLATNVSLTYSIGPSGTLSSPITIQLPLTRTVPAGSQLIVMTSESASGSWTPLKPTLSRDGKSVSVNVNHLTLFDTLLPYLEGLANEFKKDFIDPFTSPILASAQRPSCPNQSQALQGGYSVNVSSKYGALYWCLDLKGNKRVLVVVNNRRYFLDVQYPGLTVASPSPVPVGVQKIEEIAVNKQHEVLIPPGGQYVFGADIPQNTQASVKTQSDVGSQVINFLEISVEALTSALEVLGLFGLAEVPTTLAVVDGLLVFQDCGNVVAKAFTPGSGFVFGDFIKECLSAKNVTIAYGNVWGVIAAIIITVPDVIGFLINEAHATIEHFLKLDQYQIVISHMSASPCPQNAGTCIGTASGNVAGDGTDQVGVTFNAQSGLLNVYVVLANGSVVSKTVTLFNPHDGVFTAAKLLGLSDLNGAGREDVVIHTSCGLPGQPQTSSPCGYAVLEVVNGSLQPMRFYGQQGLDIASSAASGFTCSNAGGVAQVTVSYGFLTPSFLAIYQSDGKGGMQFVSGQSNPPTLTDGAHCPGLAVS